MLGEVFLRGSWTAQGPSVPGTLGGTGTSDGYYGEPGVLRDHGGSGCLYPFGTGGYVTSVGWRRPNVVALRHLVRLSRCTR